MMLSKVGPAGTRALILLGLMSFGGAPVASADDPCADANDAAQALAGALTTSVTASTQGGAFAVKPTVKGGLAVSYEISYSVGGTTVAKARMESNPADKLAGWNGYMDLTATAQGSQLLLVWDTGGNSCCKCQFTIVATGKRFRAAVSR